MKNRELKFRAWTGAKMEYNVVAGRFGAFYVNPMDNGDGLDPDDSASLSPFNMIYDKGTPIMQFTGLLDKNGREIWEGDVIRCQFGDYYSVEWFEKCFVYRNTEGFSYLQIWQPPIEKEYEVIGNIHENPELLNNK